MLQTRARRDRVVGIAGDLVVLHVVCTSADWQTLPLLATSRILTTATRTNGKTLLLQCPC